jgi:hypothetical protein
MRRRMRRNGAPVMAAALWSAQQAAGAPPAQNWPSPRFNSGGGGPARATADKSLTRRGTRQVILSADNFCRPGGISLASAAVVQLD